MSSEAGTRTRRGQSAKAAGGRAPSDPVKAARAPSATRERILREASRLFVEKGADATSMSDIAEAVNISKAGIYHFVKGKEELLFTIVSLGLDDLFEEVVTPAREIDDPVERLRFIIRRHLDVVGREGNPSRLTEAPAFLKPARRRQVEARRGAYFDFVRDTIEAVVRARHGDSALDPAVVAYAIFGAVLYVPRWREAYGRMSLDRIADQIASLTLDGLAGRGPR